MPLDGLIPISAIRRVHAGLGVLGELCLGTALTIAVWANRFFKSPSQSAENDLLNLCAITLVVLALTVALLNSAAAYWHIPVHRKLADGLVAAFLAGACGGWVNPISS